MGEDAKRGKYGYLPKMANGGFKVRVFQFLRKKESIR